MNEPGTAPTDDVVRTICDGCVADKTEAQVDLVRVRYNDGSGELLILCSNCLVGLVNDPLVSGYVLVENV